MIENLIAILILVIIIASSTVYLYKAKKRGQKCVGCPYSKTCSSNCCNLKND